MKTVITLLLSIFFFQIVFSQQEEPQELQEPFYPPFASFSPAFFIGIPTGAFEEKIDALAPGIGLDILYKFPYMPLSAGLQAGFSRYDIEKLEYSELIDGELQDFEWKTRNNIWLFHAVIRIEAPVIKNIQPYFDGIFGTKRLFTKSVLEDEFSDEEGPLETYIDNSNWTFSFGGAIGLQIPLTSFGHVMLDIRCAYLQGNHAEYYVRKNEVGEIEDTIEAFELKSSPTNMLIPQIGVTLNLSFYDAVIL